MLERFIDLDGRLSGRVMLSMMLLKESMVVGWSWTGLVIGLDWIGCSGRIDWVVVWFEIEFVRGWKWSRFGPNGDHNAN